MSTNNVLQLRIDISDNHCAKTLQSFNNLKYGINVSYFDTILI